MKVTGQLLIGNREVFGESASIFARDPATNELLEPSFGGATATNVNDAAQLAWQAFNVYRETCPEQRAEFLEQCAHEISALGDQLIERAISETGLPKARIEGECSRTINQLRLFASVVRAGHYLDVRIDHPLPLRQPVARADLRLRKIPMGPVALFGASNFPLAFSVAGGDTASAFAAGCPVIVKAHSAHPGTSELVGRALKKAVESCDLPSGVFSLLFGSGQEVGQELVKHPLIKAVGFTGSRSGGTALIDIAASRPEPIPVYAEMSSINPVFLMPEALKARAREIGLAFAQSLTISAGQLCTNPGLVIALRGPELDCFLDSVTDVLKEAKSQTMLTPGIHQAYTESVLRLAKNPKTREVVVGVPTKAPNQGRAGLYLTNAHNFINDGTLREEMFGATSLVVECQDVTEFIQVAESLDGQLTATLQLDKGDYAHAGLLIAVLERKAGRILCNGFPTGVEVCHAMVHGGPFPATSDSRTTSVGSAAIDRFLRPVCYQDVPDELLPAALRNENPLSISRLIDGKLQLA